MNDEQKIAEKRLENDIEAMKHRIAMEGMIAEAEKQNAFKKEIGLTLMESDAKLLHEKLVEAAIELAIAVEMDKNKFVIKLASRKFANTRTMYNRVCKSIFKICLKHGVKSEHTKSN